MGHTVPDFSNKLWQYWSHAHELNSVRALSLPQTHPHCYFEHNHLLDSDSPAGMYWLGAQSVWIKVQLDAHNALSPLEKYPYPIFSKHVSTQKELQTYFALHPPPWRKDKTRFTVSELFEYGLACLAQAPPTSGAQKCVLVPEETVKIQSAPTPLFENLLKRVDLEAYA